ncbi:MAG TPA: hypothetical protein V6D05_15355 [Stenomitos sp.]
MGLSPMRLGLALVIGGVATGALYMTQQTVGHPPSASAAVAPAKPQALAVAPEKPQAPVAEPKAALPLPAPPRRIVFRHTAPGDVVLTVHGDELQVEFVSPQPPAQAASKPSTKPPSKAPVKVSARLPHMATPVATP